MKIIFVFLDSQGFRAASPFFSHHFSRGKFIFQLFQTDGAEMSGLGSVVGCCPISPDSGNFRRCVLPLAAGCMRWALLALSGD